MTRRQAGATAPAYFSAHSPIASIAVQSPAPASVSEYSISTGRPPWTVLTHDALGLELLEPFGEQVVRDPGDPLPELPEPAGPVQEHADDLRVPPPAEDLGRTLEVLADLPLGLGARRSRPRAAS